MSAFWKQLLFQLLLLLVSCRHINTKTTGPTTPSPQDAISPLPTDEKSVILKGEISSEIEKVVVCNPVNLKLQCTWAGNHNKSPNITGYWRKDGAEIENSTVQLENGQYNLIKDFRIVNKEDLGNYSCIFGSEAEIVFILAAPQMGEVRDKPIVSYVGDSVVLLCKMEDSKPKPNTWHWFKDNGTYKEQISVDAEPLRYEIKNEDKEVTRLVVHNLTEADSGFYYCGAVYAISTSLSHVELKVITFYEPLKPFISILVEVIILVAIILLYEKSQSKKDESAPGSGMNADSTNTLTQGENSGQEENSSMRQRKV